MQITKILKSKNRTIPFSRLTSLRVKSWYFFVDNNSTDKAKACNVIISLIWQASCPIDTLCSLLHHHISLLLYQKS